MTIAINTKINRNNNNNNKKKKKKKKFFLNAFSITSDQ